MKHATMEQHEVKNRLAGSFGPDEPSPPEPSRELCEDPTPDQQTVEPIPPHGWDELYEEFTPELQQMANQVREDWLTYRRADIRFRYRLGGLVNEIKDQKDKYGQALVPRLAAEFDLESNIAYEAGRVAARIPTVVMNYTVEIVKKTGNDRVISWTHLRRLSESDQLPEDESERVIWLKEQLDAIAREQKTVEVLRDSLRSAPDETASTPPAATTEAPAGTKADGASTTTEASPVERVGTLLQQVLEVIETERATARDFRQELLSAVRACPPNEQWTLAARLEEVRKKYVKAMKLKSDALKEAIEISESTRRA